VSATAARHPRAQARRAAAAGRHARLLAIGVAAGALEAGLLDLGVIWRGLAELSEERLSILVATLVITGIQVFFSSFVLSILGLRRRR